MYIDNNKQILLLNIIIILQHIHFLLNQFF